MIVRAVVLRERAARDVERAVDWYRRHAGEAVALLFVESLEQTLQRIARHPAAGSLKYALELDLPGLRTSLLSGFPYLVFHVAGGAHAEVWRVLHGERDPPTAFVADDVAH